MQPEQSTQIIADNGVSFDNIDSSLTVYILKRWWQILLALIATVALILLMAVFSNSNVLIGVAPFVIFLFFLQSKYESALYKSFATKNGYSYSAGGGVDEQNSILFSVGRDHHVENIVRGLYESWDFRLFTLSYTIGYGKYSTTYHRTIMSVDYKIDLPNFFLRRPGLMSFLDKEGESLSKSGYTEELNLEGDFHKHFNVHIRPGTQIDVLSLLTPEVMQVLKPLDKYEVEMAESGEFYIYCKNSITKKQELIDIYKILDTVTIEIGQYANRQKQLHTVNPASSLPGQPTGVSNSK